MTKFEAFEKAIFLARDLGELDLVMTQMRLNEDLTDAEKEELEADSFGVYDCFQARKFAESY